MGINLKIFLVILPIVALAAVFFSQRPGAKELILAYIRTHTVISTSSPLELEERIKTEYVYMDDSPMLERIRRSLTHPQQNTSLRNLLATPPTGLTSQMGEDVWVDNYLKQKTNGFFVECGAADGERYSNTIFFELKRNWTGLLIEAGPKNYIELLEKRRNVYSLHACLSPVPRPQILNFIDSTIVGALADFQEKSHLNVMKSIGINVTGSTTPVMCYPFYSIMLAIGINRIDFFSLDIEGAELPVLRTIPLDKIHIDLFVVEYLVWGSDVDGLRKLEDLRKFFASTNLYKEVGTIHGWDVAFQHL